jgi:hypothetical protein
VQPHKAENTDMTHGDGLNRSSVESHGNMERAKGLGQLVEQILTTHPLKGEED